MKKMILLLLIGCLIGGSMSLLTNDFIGQQTQSYNGGWNLPIASTWTYSSADAPSFVVSIDGSMAGILSAGMRVRLQQDDDVKYFIVTSVADYDDTTGKTLVTLYGGTDYTLTNETILNPAISMVKAPYGFPLDQEKWTVSVTDTTLRTQATPTDDTWYNLGSISISIPIGAWQVAYKVTVDSEGTTPGATVETTLSTSNNSESHSRFSQWFYGTSQTAASFDDVGATARVREYLILTEKTTFYLNTRTTLPNSDVISNFNDFIPLVISAVCAYL